MLPSPTLRDLLMSPLAAESKILALWLAAEGPASRDDCGKALKLHAHEVERACRDLSRPQVRWMSPRFESARLELVDDCPLLPLFKRPKKKDPANAPG